MSITLIKCTGEITSLTAELNYVLMDHINRSMTLRHSIKSVTGLFIWLGFAIVFFYAGLFFTEWLLGDESFRGGWRWIMVIAFPFLIPGFFLVNRRYGCAGGFCRVSAQPDRDSVQRLPPA